ncbi:MAG TPA: sugar ABC transporter permease [Paracoccus sp. (in: a-proteobacteria)]|uniref:carbohydrate ABC transporter permease n=1 Tax=uncultured Paracoccus sp. TaxID=189685 RepID=UPI00262C076F|nr:sugar ABC transporter permease [uncultured Paracoccus sp.]HMQ41945.1 sugar ABC transporter permease [Paracoccus sp. (in: a-proteobacteria)]HMR36753.1 sugar ABC transporter permease [Paracoccus sp. (in: a-proteobacteria)]
MKNLFRKMEDEPWLFLAPALLIYAIFAIWPMIDVTMMSFQRWNGLDPERVFVGLSNYRYVLTQDAVFWTAFVNTVIWTLLSLVCPPLIGLLLALGLNQPLVGRSALRAIYYLPVIIAPIAVATMWRWMYDPFFGLFAQMLTNWGFGTSIPDFLGNRETALYWVFVAYVWQQVGFSMVLFLAGLQNVDRSLVEAAQIDGAGRWKTFRYVTMPAIMPTITIVLVLSLIQSIKAFDIVYGLTGGGPSQSTQMLALWAFTQSMQIFDFGRGGAISVILLLITVVIVIPYLRWSMKNEGRS